MTRSPAETKVAPRVQRARRLGCTLAAVSALGCTAVLDFDRAQLPRAVDAAPFDAPDVVDAPAVVDVTSADRGDGRMGRSVDVAAFACEAGTHACGVVPRCRACCDHSDCDDGVACTVDTCTADGVCEHARCDGGVCDGGCAL